MLELRGEIWGLADCNNFFVSCERTVRPELEGRACVVLSNNDGCVVARSNEAKALGVGMGQPAFELRDMFRAGKLIPLSGNHLLYRKISHHVHSIFRRFAPRALDYSVDEAFLEMTGIPFDALAEIGSSIVAACRDEAGIPVTVGFAPTKTLAKCVTERAKKERRSVGLMRSADPLPEELRGLEIGELWGIGRRLARRLCALGIYTVSDFLRRDSLWVRSTLGVCGERSWRELRGEPCIALDHVDRKLQQSVSESRTFPHDVGDYDYLRARIAIYASDCAARLRAMNGVCGGVRVFLRTNRFHLSGGYHESDMLACISTPTSDTGIIAGAATEALRRIYVGGRLYKRGGVELCSITPASGITPSLFDEPGEGHPGSDRLMKTIDRLNSVPGLTCVKLASSLTEGHPGHNDGYSSTFQYR